MKPSKNFETQIYKNKMQQDNSNDFSKTFRRVKTNHLYSIFSNL